MSDSIAGDGKGMLEESGEEAEARKAASTGGQHRPGPADGCQGCVNIAEMKLTPYERDRYQGAWIAWHRQSMLEFVPTEVLISHWREANRLVAVEEGD